MIVSALFVGKVNYERVLSRADKPSIDGLVNVNKLLRVFILVTYSVLVVNPSKEVTVVK
jgi:hypothetical protein